MTGIATRIPACPSPCRGKKEIKESLARHIIKKLGDDG
jgi:hypothetical protein